MKKKLMATLLALALVLSLVPTVFAAEGEKKVCTPAGDGTEAVVGNEQCDAASHLAGCPKKCQSTDPACDKTITTGNYCDDHQPKVDPTPSENPDPDVEVSFVVASIQYDCKCDKSTHGEDKNATCTNKVTKTNVTLKYTIKTSEKDDADKVLEAQTTAINAEKTKKPYFCSACERVAGCNPCTVANCTLLNGHSGAHEKAACTGITSCPNKAFKTADAHSDEGCLALCSGTASCLSKGDKHNANCVAKCTGTNACPNTNGNPAVHKANCPKGCTQNANCPQTSHKTLCTSQCTGAADCPFPADAQILVKAEVPATGTEGQEGYNPGTPAVYRSAHKDNCIKKCTYVAPTLDANGDVTNPGNPGTNCPNTSGDPTVHHAGCIKATVENSVVLDANGKPVESEKPGEITKAEDFSDVNAGDWFAADLDTVIEKGWVKGNEDGSFDPEGDVSGEQAVVFVSRMLNKGFNTEGENWADEATAWADKDGLTEGIEITSEGIARKDLILLLWRAAGKPASEKEVTFSDLDGVEGDHLTALKWAVENGIILGNDDGTFTPDSTTSRSQISVILVRYDKAVNK